jgi:hypothetical protein
MSRHNFHYIDKYLIFNLYIYQLQEHFNHFRMFVYLIYEN